MEKLKVNSHDILIGNDLEIAEIINERLKSGLRINKILIFTDKTVDAIHKNFIDSLSAHLKLNYQVYKYKIPSGEKFKSLATVSEIYNFMTSINFNRFDLIICIGGGVIGDLAGFIASTYMRGVKFINISTTLLSQVDSCTGSKNGINLNCTKNIIGTFYDPILVICDTKFLKSLSANEISNGIAEIVKYGFISDPNILELLEKCDFSISNSYELQNLILKCLKIKKEIVESDRFESNQRIILNFGHTIGHAIERMENFQKYPHGQAVSIGMSMITEIAVKHGLANKEVLVKLREILNKFRLPIKSGQLDANLLTKSILKDKKTRGDKINFVIVLEIGKTLIHTVNLSELNNFLLI